MNVSLFQAAAALNANSRWQESIADNLAASSIPGFKKQDLSFGAVEAGLMPSSANGPQHFSLPSAGVSTNFEPGEMKFTGVKTDVGLEGRGFLAVQITILVPAFIVSEATLSYVGLGFSEPIASWGTMLQEASNVRTFADFPWLLSPAAAMFVFVLGLNLVAQASSHRRSG